MKTRFLCLTAFFAVTILFLKNPSRVFGLNWIGECGCRFTLEGECKENLTNKPCPELQRCSCEPLGSAAPFVCKGTCVEDLQDPHCNPNPGTGSKADGIRTAIGCIPTNNLNEFVKWILTRVVFVASGIAFLLMAFGAFQIITSAGSPEKAKAGSELITSALSGLLFIILSVFLLKLIGVDILHIPGL